MNTVEQEAGQLALGLRRRDLTLIDYLIQQYHYRLFRYLLMVTGSREEAEDLFQETWIRVLEKGHQYKQRWKFETWLFTIARHLAIDFLRRQQPQRHDALLQPMRTSRPLESVEARRTPGSTSARSSNSTCILRVHNATTPCGWGIFTALTVRGNWLA
jgi:RNA polymerase sigma-70 factor (ECF subfamily)